MEKKTFNVPFGVLRGLLPPDGERIVVWHGRMNQWKQNRTPFERHETAEIAFGRAIRAQRKHRDNERSMSPGIVCGTGSIQLRGGWAAHKAVDHHNDYFDGEFNATVTLAVNDGRVSSSVSVPRLTWNESFVGKLGNLVGDIANKMVEKFRQQLENGLQRKLEAVINEKIEEVLQQVPQAKVLRQHLSIALLPDTVAITVAYQKPRLVVTRPKAEDVVRGSTTKKRLSDALQASKRASTGTRKAAASPAGLATKPLTRKLRPAG